MGVIDHEPREWSVPSMIGFECIVKEKESKIEDRNRRSAWAASSFRYQGAEVWHVFLEWTQELR